MIRFVLSDSGETISIDPNFVASVCQAVVPAFCGKSLLSGNQQGKQTATITMSNGEKFTVDDPNFTVTSQIESAKRTGT